MARRNPGSIIGTAAIITVITMGSKLLGFIRECVIAYFFGTSYMTDAYLVSVSIPTILLGFLTSVGNAYTPIYAEISVNRGQKQAEKFTTATAIAALAICFSVSLLLVFFPCPIVAMISPGYPPEIQTLTARYLRITIWDIPLVSLLSIYIAYLQNNDRFISAAVCMLAHSSFQILLTVAAGIFGAFFLPVGYVLADVSYLFCVVWCVRRSGYRLSGLCTEKRYFADIFRLLIPMFLSSMLTQINGFVDKYFASSLTEGSVSALNYSNTIRTFAVMMINTGVTTVLYPVLSKAVVKDDVIRVRTILWTSIRYSVIMFLPMTCGILILSENLVQVMFGRGSFDARSVEMTAAALSMYTVGLIAVGIRDVLIKLFYAHKDSSTVMRVSFLTILTNVLFNILLVRFMGHAGLALGTSLSALVSIPLFFRKAEQYVGKPEQSDLPVSFLLKIVAACLVMCVLIDCMNLLPLPLFVRMTAQTLLGALVYFVCLVFLRTDDVLNAIQTISKRVGKIWKR